MGVVLQGPDGQAARRRAIEAIERSTNTKIIITDGKTPLQLGAGADASSAPYD